MTKTSRFIDASIIVPYQSKLLILLKYANILDTKVMKSEIPIIIIKEKDNLA